MKVLTAFARLAEHPSQTVWWVSIFTTALNVLWLFMVVLGGVLSLFFGQEAFLFISGWMGKPLWIVVQIVIPLGAAEAAIRLNGEWRLAMRNANTEKELGQARWAYLKHSSIVLLCTSTSIMATLGMGSILFRASGFDDEWFTMMTHDLFLGMQYASIFAAVYVLFRTIWRYLMTGGRMNTPR